MKVYRDPQKPTFQWRTPSNSIKGKYYIVGYSEGKWTCNCFAGSMGKECRHIRKVKNIFKKKTWKKEKLKKEQ
jgi:hypothetical protein